MPDAAAHDDLDSPWKEVVEHAFPEFIDFYFPHASRQIDWARGYTFLDKELQKIARDGELGRRYVDKLVRVTTLAGEEDWLCVHIEVQGEVDHDFERRMFVYNYRIFDTYDRPVASLAVLADNDPTWRPDHFEYERLGCRHSLHFPVAKLVDYIADEASLLANPNPFALITAAHLYTRRTRKSQLDASTPSAAWSDCSTNETGPANASSTSSGCSTGCSSCPIRSSASYGKILKTLKEHAK